MGGGALLFSLQQFSHGWVENFLWQGGLSPLLPWALSQLGSALKQPSPPASGPKSVLWLRPTSVVRKPFCFWVRGPELRPWGFGHWVPQLIFFSGLDIPLGAVDRGTLLEGTPSSSPPGGGKQRMRLESCT